MHNNFFFLQMICVGFWGIFLYDRKIMYPAELDNFFPFVYCHIYHTVPAALVLIEMSKRYRKLPPLFSSLCILSTIMIIYIAVWVNVFTNYLFKITEIFFSVKFMSINMGEKKGKNAIFIKLMWPLIFYW